MISLDCPPTPILNNPTSFWFVFVEEKCVLLGNRLSCKNQKTMFWEIVCVDQKNRKKRMSEDFFEKTLMPAEHCNFAKRISHLKSCSSILESSYLKHFQWALVFRRRSSVFLVLTKAWRDCSKLPIKTQRKTKIKKCNYYLVKKSSCRRDQRGRCSVVNWTTFPHEEKSKEQQ